MNELPLPAEFLVLPALLLLLVAVNLLVNYQNRHKRQKQLAGLTLLHHLKQLIAHIQQHRGSSYGLVNGSQTMQIRVNELQTLIYDDWKQLATVAPQLKANERWQESTRHWVNLGKDHATLAPSNNLLQHNCLISNLLYLLQDIAVEYHLTEADIPDSKNLSLFWRELPEIAEYVGQARAFGTGIAAQGFCSNLARYRMNLLKEKIQHSVERNLTTICEHELINGSGKSNVFFSVNYGLQRLLSIIENELIADHVPMILAEEYFAIATQSLDQVLELFDMAIEQLAIYASPLSHDVNTSAAATASTRRSPLSRCPR